VFNEQTVIGYLGKDPEVKSVGSGTVTTLSIATSEKWKDKDGNKQERTEWFEVNFWDTQSYKPSEILPKYAKKGQLMWARGETQTRTYDDKDGVKRYRTSVRGKDFKFLGGSKDRGEDDQGHGHHGGQQPPSAPASDDDIPF